MNETLSRGIRSDVPSVLVVDDDIDCLAALCELIDDLGFSVRGVDTVKSALLAITEDPAIGIVVTDLRMQVLDGFDLLAEIEGRFARHRNIVRIVASAFPSVEHAVEAMRFGATDFLDKPITAEKLKYSIRRAIGKWALPKPDQSEAPALRRTLVLDEDRPSESHLSKMVKHLQRQRRLRADKLSSKLFSDPAWDILLDLMAADLGCQTVTVSSACAAAQVPFSTALRYVNRLVRADLALRFNDPTDKRRDLLRISNHGRTVMMDYIQILVEKDKELFALDQ